MTGFGKYERLVVNYVHSKELKGNRQIGFFSTRCYDKVDSVKHMVYTHVLSFYVYPLGDTLKHQMNWKDGLFALTTYVQKSSLIGNIYDERGIAISEFNQELFDSHRQFL